MLQTFSVGFSSGGDADRAVLCGENGDGKRIVVIGVTMIEDGDFWETYLNEINWRGNCTWSSYTYNIPRIMFIFVSRRTLVIALIKVNNLCSTFVLSYKIQ
jgi:hypothetical protein